MSEDTIEQQQEIARQEAIKQEVLSEMDEAKTKHGENYFLNYFGNYYMHFNGLSQQSGYRRILAEEGGWNQTYEEYLKANKTTDIRASNLRLHQTGEQFYQAVDKALEEELSEQEKKEARELIDLRGIHEKLQFSGKKFIDFLFNTEESFQNKIVADAVKSIKAQGPKNFFKTEQADEFISNFETTVLDRITELLTPAYIKLRIMGYSYGDLTA
jgi:hypothetical protein